MEAKAVIFNEEQKYYLEVVHSQVVFDLQNVAGAAGRGFKIVVNPARFAPNAQKEIAIAKVGYSEDRYTLKFFFEKASLDESIKTHFFRAPRFRVVQNFILPNDLLVYFALPYHIIEKGEYRILEDEKHYYIEF